MSKNHNFFALISRMKYINRWSLMRNAVNENISEHSLQVAAIAHCLAVISNKLYGGGHNPEKVALYALYHDASEILTGDMPTPVKYQNSKISDVYKEIEQNATKILVSYLPNELQEEFGNILLMKNIDKSSITLIKCADKIAAYIKCIEEEIAGNTEFKAAKSTIIEKIYAYDLPEVKYFFDNFIDGYNMSIDGLLQ